MDDRVLFADSASPEGAYASKQNPTL